MTFTREQLQPLVDDRWINAQRHPTLPLTIYNYTPRCQFAKHWTADTMAARGLVLDDNDTVVMRGFPKFFNRSEWNEAELPTEPYNVYEKMDGSLFLVGRYDGHLVTATRGSFTSPQSDLGRALIKGLAPEWLFCSGVTYCFELIHPENRIVVNYGGRSELVLLAIIANDTGETLLPDDDDRQHFTINEPISIGDMERILSDPDEQVNREGFVLHWPDADVRVKVKFDDYVRLHRLVTGISARRIWEHLRDGHDIGELIERVPDEFYEWVRRIESELREKFINDSMWQHYVYRKITTIDSFVMDRKTFALAVADAVKEDANTDASVLFRMFDRRSYDDLIWKRIKPVADRPFREDEP